MVMWSPEAEVNLEAGTKRPSAETYGARRKLRPSSPFISIFSGTLPFSNSSKFEHEEGVRFQTLYIYYDGGMVRYFSMN